MMDPRTGKTSFRRRLASKLGLSRSRSREPREGNRSDEVKRENESHRQSTLVQPTLSKAPDNPSIRELWNIAYESLRDEDESPIKDYEDKLPGNLTAGLGSSLAASKARKTDVMHAILVAKVKEVERNVWKLRFGDITMPLKDLLVPLEKIIVWANDYISDALSANPYASIAWAGVSLLLPLLLNPSAQTASLAKGLEYIARLIVLSRMREEYYVQTYETKDGPGPDGQKRSQQSHDAYKSSLTDLYKAVLRFQATAYCHLVRNSAARLGFEMIAWNDWDSLIKKIRSQDDYFQSVSKEWHELEEHREHIMAAQRDVKALEHLSSLGTDVSDMLQEIQRVHADKKNVDLFRWLSTVDYSRIYNTARTYHEDTTNDWLLTANKQFQSWQEDPESFLWIHGKAGSGKSILSSSIINHLLLRNSDSPLKTVAYFFFSFSNDESQGVDMMLASFIKQICSYRPRIPAKVEKLEQFMVRGGRPGTPDLLEAFHASVQGFSSVYIVIDALDECPTRNRRRQLLLKALKSILAEMPACLHVLCTSRKESDIERDLRTVMSLPSRGELDLARHCRALDRDIGIYIDSTLASADWPDSVKAMARELLIEKADGMFQYVRCQLDELQGLSSQAAIQEALRSLPIGLDSTYDRMLANVDARVRARVKTLLIWLAFSFAPLEPSHLSEIFALHPKIYDGAAAADPPFSDQHVLNHLSALVVKDKTGEGDRVRLAHFSIKEYLTSDRISESPASRFAFTEVDAHLEIARYCIFYQVHDGRVKPLDGKCKVIVSPASLKYALKHWSHLELVPRELWTKMIPDVRDLFVPRSVTYEAIMKGGELRTFEDHHYRRPWCFTARCSYVHLTEILFSGDTSKYRTQEDLDLTLYEAAKGGSTDLCELLLSMGANPNGNASEAFWTPLIGAIQFGCFEVVECLLDCGADINATHAYLGTPLHHAVLRAEDGMVRAIINRGAKINVETADMGPPLIWTRRRDIAEILLAAGADVNFQGSKRWGTPLYHAAKWFSSRFPEPDLIDYFLSMRADPNERGGEYCLPLHEMCRATGYFSIWFPRVSALLDHGADINAVAENHGTALGFLCSDRGNVLNSNSTSGELAEFLPKAAAFLIEKGADVNATGGDFGTALQAACAFNSPAQDALIDCLLEHHADPNIKAGRHGTSLHAACTNAGPGIVRKLIDHGADLNALDAQGTRSVLEAACSHTDLRMAAQLVDLLLERGVDKPVPEPVDAPRTDDLEHVMAGLRWTCVPSPEAKRLLLSLRPPVVEPVRMDNPKHERPAPSIVAQEHADLLNIFLASQTDSDDLHMTLFGYAFEQLMEPEYVADHVSLLQVACSAKYRIMGYTASYIKPYDIALWILTTRPDIDVNAEGGIHGTALQGAAFSGQRETVLELLRRGARVDARGGKYRGALNAAVMAHNWDIVDDLLEAGATPDCELLQDPDEEWLVNIGQKDGRGAVERYRKFWEVQVAEAKESSAPPEADPA